VEGYQMQQPASSQVTPPTNWFERSKDAVAILGGLSAFFIALLWYFGWSYNQEYFKALNIPYSQLSFPIWEYGMVGWSQFPGFAFYVIVYIAITYAKYLSVTLREAWTKIPRGWVIFCWVFSFIGIVILMFSKANGYLVLSVAMILYLIQPSPIEKGSVSSIEYVSFFIISLAFTIAMIFVGQSFSGIAGREGAARHIQREALTVTILLDTPVMSDLQPIAVPHGEQSLYSYDNLLLLTYNNDYYYVAQSIDSACRPTKVYVIPRQYVVGADYRDEPALRPTCRVRP
jgi:hypothetical protein